MKQLECYYVLLLLVPFGYSLELVNLDKLEAENDAPFNLDLKAETDSLKTREERSPHFSSDFYPGFFNIFEGAQQGSHEQEQDCPFPYKRVGENCYYAICSAAAMASSTLYWNAARSYCQSIRGGGDLAVFDSANDYADAVRYLKSLDPTGASHCDYWIGGSGSVTTVGTTSVDQWLWIDGTTMPQGVPFWGYLPYPPTTPPPTNLLPTPNSAAWQNVYLGNLDSYFFHYSNGSSTTYLPFCQIRLERGHKEHTNNDFHEGSHEEYGFRSNINFPRSDQQPFSSHLRQNYPLSSSQSAPNNHFTRFFGNNPQTRRMPYVKNSQKRNLQIPPGQLSGRKANEPYLEKTKEPKSEIVSIEPKGEGAKLQQYDNQKSVDGQLAEEGLIQELPKDSAPDTKKKISTVDMNTDRIAADELMKESDDNVPTNIEHGASVIPLKGDIADINLPIYELKSETTETKDAAIKIHEHEEKFIKQEEGDHDNPLKEHKDQVIEHKNVDKIAVLEIKDDPREQEVTVNNPAHEHEDGLIKQETELKNPVNKHKEELFKQESDITTFDYQNKDELIKQEADINFPIYEQKNELKEQRADMNIPANEHRSEFLKDETKKKILTDTHITKENDNFNHLANMEVSTEQETPEGKRSELQSDDLNSYLPGMIYDIVNILQNIDRNYKPRFDRTKVVAP